MGSVNNFLNHLNSFIDSNILGWEVVLCLICDKHEEECQAPCPVALACALRDSILNHQKVKDMNLEPLWCIACSGFNTPERPCLNCNNTSKRYANP